MKYCRKRKEGEREITERKQRETGRGVKAISIAYTSLTSPYAYQWGLVVRAHPASIAAINLRFPTVFKE